MQSEKLARTGGKDTSCTISRSESDMDISVEEEDMTSTRNKQWEEGRRKCHIKETPYQIATKIKF